MNVINFHFTNCCNYKCVYCFAKSKNKAKELSFEECMQVVDMIQEYFVENNISDGRINLVGGEPLVSPFIQELIDYCFQKGIQVSIVTNASLLSCDFVQKNKNKLYMIGISVDSLIEKTNLKIGRCCASKTLNREALVKICKEIKKCGIKLKINTVVSKLNCKENFADFNNEVEADKIKVFQMCHVKGVNDKARQYKISQVEFESFCNNNQTAIIMVVESESDMQSSYLMINNYGDFILNDNGEYKSYGNILKEKLSALIKKSNFDGLKFEKRYGGNQNV